MEKTNGGDVEKEDQLGLGGETSAETELPKAGETVSTPEGEQITMLSDAVAVEEAPEGAETGEPTGEVKEEPKPKPRGVNVSMKETIADLTKDLTEEVKAHERTKMMLSNIKEIADRSALSFIRSISAVSERVADKNDELKYYRITSAVLLIAVVIMALKRGG